MFDEDRGSRWKFSTRAGQGSTIGDSGGDARTVRSDDRPVGEELTGVVEEDDTVAEQTPSLFGVAGDDPGRFVVGVLGGGTGRFVAAHGWTLSVVCWLRPTVVADVTCCCRFSSTATPLCFCSLSTGETPALVGRFSPKDFGRVRTRTRPKGISNRRGCVVPPDGCASPRPPDHRAGRPAPVRHRG